MLDVKQREKAFEALIKYLVSNQLVELQMLKLWKGLFYCYWMSDKPLVQQHLANRLAELITSIPQPLDYIDAFYKTISREWYNIDRLRLDKYYNLLNRFLHHAFSYYNTIDFKEFDKYLEIIERLLSDKPGLAYHAVENLLLQLEQSVPSLSNHIAKQIINVYLTVLKSTNDPILAQNILNVFKVYENESWLKTIIEPKEMSLMLYSTVDYLKNSRIKSLAEDFMKLFGTWTGIPFVNKVVVTGLKKEVVQVDWKNSIHEIGKTDTSTENQDSPKKRKQPDFKQPAQQGKNKEKRRLEQQESLPKKSLEKENGNSPSGKSVKLEESPSAKKSLDQDASPKMSSKQKESNSPAGKGVKTKEIINAKKSLDQEESSTKTDPIEEKESDSPSGKSVTWNTRIKFRKFYKRNTICQPGNPIPPVSFTGPLKSVLKPFAPPLRTTKKKRVRRK